MVFTQYFNFNVDTATAVALKLPLKAESVGSCVGAGTKLWSSLFGTCKELLDNFSSSVFFCTYRSHIISWLHEYSLTGDEKTRLKIYLRGGFNVTLQINTYVFLLFRMKINF